MLNGNDKISGFKTNRSNQQKTNCTCSTLFLLISKKQICTNLSFPSLCFARLRPCSKTSNFLVSHYFLWRNCRVLTQYCVSCVHARFYFSLPRVVSFSPCWPLAFLIFSPPRFEFPCFSPTKFVSFVFNNSLQLFLCYPRQCKHKN